MFISKKIIDSLLILPFIILLVSCAETTQSVDGEDVPFTVAADLTQPGTIVDSGLIQLATWNSVDKILLVQLDVKASDEVILLNNFADKRGIAAKQVYQDGIWVVEKTLQDLGFVPCIVEAKTRIRIAKLVVTGALNCGAAKTNVLPVPKITQPAGTLTIRRGDTLSFVGEITDPDNNGPFTYHWNFAGVALATATTVNEMSQTTAAITFNKIGNYAIILRVTDVTGEMSMTNAQRHVLVVDDGVATPLPTPFPSFPNSTTEEALGRKIFFDVNLSEPVGLACSSCHDPSTGWADPDRDLSVSQGAIGNFGLRNAPSTAYAAQAPEFVGGLTPKGGQFWDGRATNLVEQAQYSLLSINQLGNLNRSTIVQKVKNASYAPEFEQLYGVGIFDNLDLAFVKIAETIVAYETSLEMNVFSSKFDAVAAGRAQFTAQEQLGLSLFNGKAYCSVCHSSRQIDNTLPLFSDYGYANLGLPTNQRFPFDSLSPRYIDMGLGEVLVSGALIGKFKTPSLRNVAITAPYMHSGVFTTLQEVVRFYNTRDVATEEWPVADIVENREQGINIGNLGLTDDEEAAIVVFLQTLTDGFD